MTDQTPEVKSKMDCVWDIVMFRKLMLPCLVSVLNLLNLIVAVVVTIMSIPDARFQVIFVMWSYTIIVRIVSEIWLLAWRYLRQKTESALPT
jgi:hypothetical protein